MLFTWVRTVDAEMTSVAATKAMPWPRPRYPKISRSRGVQAGLVGQGLAARLHALGLRVGPRAGIPRAEPVVGRALPRARAARSPRAPPR